MPGASKNPHPLADGMAIKTVEMRSPIPIAIIKLLLFMSARPRDTTGCSQRYTPIIPGLFTIIRADLHSKCTGFSTGYQQCFACKVSYGEPQACLFVIASQRVGVAVPRKKMDCFVALLLAMTARRTFAFSRRNVPELFHQCPSNERAQATLKRGRRECRMPRAPAASRVVKNTRVSHHRYTGSEPAFPAQWF